MPLDGIIETAKVFALVKEEPIDKRDRNGDGDPADHVLTLTDRVSGDERPIGEDGTAGRAIARLNAPPFSSPAVAVENDVAAFLELESTQQKHDGDGDEDGNNSTADTILRVFRMQSDAAVELTTPGGLLAVNAAPVIDHQSVVVFNRRVFFRARPHASAAEETFLVSTNLRGEPANGSTTEGAVVAADGRHVAFLSNATNLTDSSDGRLHVFVAADDGAIERVDVGTDQFGHSLDDGAASTVRPALSGDGRFVVFADSQFNAFVRDRNPAGPTTERLNVSAAGVPGEGGVRGSDRVRPFAAVCGEFRHCRYSRSRTWKATGSGRQPDKRRHVRT